MQSNILAQVQNSDKNTEIKFPQRGNLFIRCWEGYVVEFSKDGKTTVHDFNYKQIESIATTPDNKS